MNIDEDRKIKQSLLKSEILEKGYDGVKFTNFMESRKRDGNLKKAPILITGICASSSSQLKSL